jgi:hypothetical protein
MKIINYMQLKKNNDNYKIKIFDEEYNNFMVLLSIKNTKYIGEICKNITLNDTLLQFLHPPEL